MKRVPSHALAIRRDALPDAQTTVIVLQPSPAVEPWSSDFSRAMGDAERAQALLERDPAGAVQLLRVAQRLVPDAMLFVWKLGEALVAASRPDEAVAVLERGLAGAGLDDVQYTMRARQQLARLYTERGRAAEAAQQYRLILSLSDRTELRSEAETFLDRHD